MKRFFHKENSRLPFRRNGVTVQFDSYENFAGAWRGVIATEDPRALDVLGEAAAEPGSGIRELTQADYEAALKKKATIQSSVYSPPLENVSPQIRPGAAVPVVVDGAYRFAVPPAVPLPPIAPPPPATAPATQSLDDLLQIISVPPAVPPEPVNPSFRETDGRKLSPAMRRRGRPPKQQPATP